MLVFVVVVVFEGEGQVHNRKELIFLGTFALSFGAVWNWPLIFSGLDQSLSF